MIRHGIAKRYAKALYQLDNGRMPDFTTLFSLFKSQPKLAKLLQAPLITQEEKEQLLTKALEGRVKPLFLHFLFFIIKKKRTHSLQEIFVEYELLVDSYAGIWEAELISGTDLPPDAKNELMKKLETSYSKKIAIKEQVSEDIIGGTLLILGNKEIDWRVETRMDKLKKHLLGFDVCR